jgi:hypothetical protein
MLHKKPAVYTEIYMNLSYHTVQKSKPSFVGRKWLSENLALYEIITRKAAELQISMTELCTYCFVV